LSEEAIKTISNESTDERIHRTLEVIGRIIASAGEHGDCELKKVWLRDTPYNRAEFIKDIQSISNSDIASGGEKWIVVGVDEATRTFVGCNHADFDEAAIRQLLAAHLDRVPEFELFKPHAPNGSPYVVVRIPRQPKRPFIARKTIMDDKGKAYLREGEIWVKPGGPETPGTGKQLVVTREALLSMFDLEDLVHNAATERINQMLPTIRLEERTRLGGLSIIPALTATDEEFESLVEQILISDNETKFNILLEKIRDKTVALWETVSAGQRTLTPDEVFNLKEREFLPAMRRLTQLGLLLIKFSAPTAVFSKVADQLFDIFKASFQLRPVMPGDPSKNSESLALHASYSVPAIEALLVAYLLAGFSLKQHSSIRYFSQMFRHLITAGTRVYPYLFWRYYDGGAPDRRIDLLAIERFGADDFLQKSLHHTVDVPTLVLQADCLLDWHSFLSFKEQNGPAGDPLTVAYFEKIYPPGAMVYLPSFLDERLEKVIPTLRLIAQGLATGKNDLCALDQGLAEALRAIDPDRRVAMLGRFMRYAEVEQARRMAAQGRFSFDVWWPEDLRVIVEKARTDNRRK
jgi:hypothetical protein